MAALFASDAFAPAAASAFAMAGAAPDCVRLGAALICWYGCACPVPRIFTLKPLVLARLTTNAAPPSDTGQQSSSFKGDAIGFEPSTASIVMGSLNWAPGCMLACW